MNTDKEFTIEEGINVQSIQLNDWKSILKKRVYADLEKWATKSNDSAKTGYDVVRGSCLTNFVVNYHLRNRK